MSGLLRVSRGEGEWLVKGNVLIGWNCIWLSASHDVCFLFTEPGPCIYIRVLLCAIS